jgi:hypothetical protein
LLYFKANDGIKETGICTCTFFLLLLWNLMCRLANCASISLNHLIWKGDSLGILFSQIKNDQFGDRPKDPRHVYANPFIPAISVLIF